MPDRPTRPGRRCARVVLSLLRDGRTRPEEWSRPERAAVTRLYMWAHRESGLQSWPLPFVHVRVEEDEQGVRAVPDECEHRCPTCGVRLTEPIEYPNRPSDGYLADAESWGTREQQAKYARTAGHGVLPTREVLALIRLDRILGNEGALSARGVGRLRGVVLQALREWHDRQRAVVDSIGLGPADPDGGPVSAEQLVLRQEVEEQITRAEREHAARFQAENDRDAARERADRLTAERDDLRRLLEGRARAMNVNGRSAQASPAIPAGVLSDDPRRPGVDAWPDDAVLLTYRELRRLVCLHLERYGVDAKIVRAVLEADVPLRLTEVLDR